MDFRTHSRQGVTPYTPTRQRPDGYGSIFLLGPGRAIIPAFTSNPEPRQKATPRNCCDQNSGRKLGTEPGPQLGKISGWWGEVAIPGRSAMVSMTQRQERRQERDRKHMVASQAHDVLCCSESHTPSSS